MEGYLEDCNKFFKKKLEKFLDNNLDRWNYLKREIFDVIRE
jgi:hypothetical protein